MQCKWGKWRRQEKQNQQPNEHQEEKNLPHSCIKCKTKVR